MYWKIHGRQGSDPNVNRAPPNITPSQPRTHLYPISRERPSLDANLSSSVHPAIELPPALVAQAQNELPISSRFFKMALQSAENLDESDFGRWDHPPPFIPEPLISDPETEAIYTERVAEAMHGRRLRLQKEQDKIRELENRGRSAFEVVDALRREIAEGLCEWHTVSAYLPEYNAGPREQRMACHYVEWCARKVWHLWNMAEV